MNNTQKEWNRAAEELNLEVEIPFVLSLTSRPVIEAQLLIKKFGRKNGILIFHDYEKVKFLSDELRSLGFSWSIIDEPIPGQEFNIESFIDALSDWEWKGAVANKPEWLKEPPEYELPE